MEQTKKEVEKKEIIKMKAKNNKIKINNKNRKEQ